MAYMGLRGLISKHPEGAPTAALENAVALSAAPEPEPERPSGLRRLAAARQSLTGFESVRRLIPLEDHEMVPSQADFLIKSKLHGQAHVSRVMVHAMRLIAATGHPEEAKRLWAAVYLHDMARIDDEEDPGHGRRAVKRLREMPDVQALFERVGLTPDDIRDVGYAVARHNSQEPGRGHRASRLTALLKDADGLDRVRINDLDTKFLRNKEAKPMEAFAWRMYRTSKKHLKAGDDDYFQGMSRIAAWAEAVEAEKGVVRFDPRLLGADGVEGLAVAPMGAGETYKGIGVGHELPRTGRVVQDLVLEPRPQFLLEGQWHAALMVLDYEYPDGVPGAGQGAVSLRTAAKQAAEKASNTVWGWSQIKTQAFKDWFGKSQVTNIVGQPLIVYHGTTCEFTAFDPSRCNVESDLGAGLYFTSAIADANTNYLATGKDLTNRIQGLAERLAEEQGREYDDPEVIAEAKQRLGMAHQGAILPVFLKLENPLRLGGDDETMMTYEQECDEDGEYTGEIEGTLLDFMDEFKAALARVTDDYAAPWYKGWSGEAVYSQLSGDESYSASDVIEWIKQDMTLLDFTDGNGDIMVSELIRQAFEGMGFDGVIDETAHDKFAYTRSRGGGMTGMNPDTVHYIVFSPLQVKSAIGNGGGFNPNDPDLRA